MSSFKNIFKVVGNDTPQPAPASGGDVKSRIAADIAQNKILIYMKGTPEQPQCGFSAATVDIFNQLGVSFATRNVLEDPELRQGIKVFSNWPTIPQIYINGKFVGGCDIVTELHQRNELESMVRQALGN